jgi:hypothetical protein
MYYTQTFQFSKLLYYVFINVSGYFYVTAVTLRLKRKTLFSGRRTEFRDFFACLAIGTVLYFIGPNATLKGFDDTSSLGGLVLYDFCAWTAAFWLGVNWTHMDIKPLRMLELNLQAMRRWSWQLWLLFVLASCALLGAAGYELYLLYARGLLFYVLIGYGTCFVTLFVVWLCVRSTHSFHLHHYQLFGLLVPCTLTQHWLSAIIQGLAIGGYVEGLARWGFDSCFKLEPVKKDISLINPAFS